MRERYTVLSVPSLHIKQYFLIKEYLFLATHSLAIGIGTRLDGFSTLNGRLSRVASVAASDD